MLEAGFTLFLVLAVAVISIHDFKHLRVPDTLSLSTAIAGTFYWLLVKPELAMAQILSGAAFGGAIWLLREGHSRLAGRVGLGLGDVKFSAAGAIWLNPVLLPLFLFAASLSGLAYAAFQVLTNRHGLRHERIPFAPFLGGAVIFCWMLERWR